MNNILQLKAVIERVLNRGDLSSDGTEELDDTISYYIRKAIEFYQVKQFWFNQKIADINLNAGEYRVKLPDDFISIISFCKNGDVIKQVKYSEIENYGGNSLGTPMVFSIFAGNFVVSPITMSDIKASISYIAKVEEGIWVQEAENMIRNKALEYIYQEKLKSFDRASFHAATAGSEYLLLRSRTNKNQSTGKLSIEAFL